MAAAKPVTPVATPVINTEAYDLAMRNLAAADAELVAARQRIADMETRAATLGSEAAELEKLRGIALARGELDQAADLGKKFAVASDGAKEAGRAALAMSGALDDLLINCLGAETAADDAHMAVMSAFYQSQRAALVGHLRATIYSLWRAGQASSNLIPFQDFVADIGRELDRTDIFDVPVDLPISEVSPSSEHLAGNPRRGSARRADVAFLRDAKLRAAQVEALGGQAA